MRNTLFLSSSVCFISLCFPACLFFIRYNIWTCLSSISHKSLILLSSQTSLTSSKYKWAKRLKKAITPQRYGAFHILLGLLFSKLQGHLHLLTFLSQTTAFYPGRSDYLHHQKKLHFLIYWLHLMKGNFFFLKKKKREKSNIKNIKFSKNVFSNF